ncbi:MAG: formate/nitrite transporter family protein [Bacteroidales bacterium]|nr:formate/nitrite transporter family protein [Bacteroidales bacterium]
MNQSLRNLLSPVMAGVAISLGAVVYLRVGGPVGACLFSVGLLSVVHFQFKLYTGRIWRTRQWADLPELGGVLLGNLVGCLIAALLFNPDPAVAEGCSRIVMARGEAGFWRCLVNGIGCGWIMTLAVTMWSRSPWALLIGIPAFILGGFTHSIADGFYYLAAWPVVSVDAFLGWVATAIGNFLGGTAYILGSSALSPLLAPKSNEATQRMASSD